MDTNESSKVTVSMCLVVVVGLLFVIASFYIRFGNLLSNIGQEKISDILLTSSSVKEDIENDADLDTNSKVYAFYDDTYYNQIVEFLVKGVKVYAFRMETDTIQGDESYFNYEIGRIKLNPNNPKKSKCTYNYRASYSSKPVKWFDCSETEFIKSIPEIAKLKAEAFVPLKKTIDTEMKLNLCGMEGALPEEECEGLDFSDKYWDKLEKQHEQQLTKLRTTTLEK